MSAFLATYSPLSWLFCTIAIASHGPTIYSALSVIRLPSGMLVYSEAFSDLFEVRCPPDTKFAAFSNFAARPVALKRISYVSQMTRTLFLPPGGRVL